ncbi:glycosyltransferase family 4 protein [Amaricoccus macauensis]|uniref:glycosyltransferase family 4 protein n=1 Tax=Amaricoccus macauensis TaxID=57001 RepID=UPI003C7E86A9
MQADRLWFGVPGDLETRTGGYGYDREIIGGLRALGHPVEILHWPGDFPQPGLDTLEIVHDSLRALPDGSDVLIDGLAFSAMPGVVAAEACRLNLTALVHHPLCLENGLSVSDAARLERAEHAALPHARRIIVTSPETAREVATRFSVPPERITVVLPGCSPRKRATPSSPPLILSVGSLIERKGHDTLIDALAQLTDLDWDARIVGNESADPPLASALRQRARDRGIANRLTFAGMVENAESEMMKAAIFALASRYEGYGMAFAEALAHGLPIVGCRTGAVQEVVPANAGRLVPPDDPRAFADALRELLEDPVLRANVSENAWRAGQDLPGWPVAAQQVAGCLAEARRLNRIGHRE